MLAAAILAGVIYHFTSVTEAQHGTTTVAGKIWADGAMYRLELDRLPAGHHQYDVAISRDGNDTTTWINREKQIYENRRPSPKSRSSLLFHLPGAVSSEAGRPRIRSTTLGRETVAGRNATKHRLEVDYKLRGEFDDAVIRGSVMTEVLVWTDEELPALPFERAVQTGFPKIDAAIAKAYAAFRGMTLRSEMTVTRVIEGGPPVTEKTSTTIDELAVAEIDPALFEIPPSVPSAPLR